MTVWSLYQGNSISDSVSYLLLIAVVFVCVVLHELGHALTARIYDVPTRDILILPIGGLARLEYIPTQPEREILIAAAGPAVNLVLCLMFYLLYWLFDGTPISELAFFNQFFEGAGWLIGLAIINLTLFAFNLIPAYPMDGGRILRAGLSFWFGRYRSTIIASYVAQFIAFGFILTGYFWSAFTMMLIGVFVFMTARWERTILVRARDEEE